MARGSCDSARLGPSHANCRGCNFSARFYIEFGSQVTDDKTLPKENRKEIQVKTAGKKTSDAKIIKLADKTSNMRAITFSPAPNWSVKRRLEYVGWARDVVKGLRGVSPWLEQHFDKAAAEAESSIAVRSAKL